MAERSDKQGEDMRGERSYAGIPAAKVHPPPPLGVRRDRLIRCLVDGPPGVRIVEGLAGCGKTTVLGHAAHGWTGRCAWVTVDGSDRVGNRFARALGAAAARLAPGSGPGSGDSTGPADAVDPAEAAFALIEKLEAHSEPALVIIDDAHELAGAPASYTVDLLCRYRPAHVTLVLGARHLRGLDHWRWQSEQVRELNADSLRFRLWEVQALFRDHYGTPLGAEELHAVTRLTDGWAVALHLYQVATRTLSPAERRRLVAGPRLTVRSLREYLADQVLATVDADQRALLRRIAVLDRIRPDRCERLLERRGCAEQLQLFARLGLLLPEADGVTYRLHELLRAHLLGELDEELGPGGVAGLHRLAADVLEAEGDIVEAVRACGRGGDWDGVRRLLATDDSPVVLRGPWAEDLPSRLRDTDPWVLRAIGRRQLGEGDLDGARSTLTTSVERFREHGGDVRAQRSLRLLEHWLDPDPGQQRSWAECLRAGLSGSSVDAWPDEPAGWLAEGLTGLAAGRVRAASALLRRAAATLGDEFGVVAELGLCLAAALSEPDPMPAADRALARARGNGAPALVAAAESLAAFAAGGIVDPDVRVTMARERRDVIGDGLHSFVTGLTFLCQGLPAAAGCLDRATELFRDAGLTLPGATAHAAAVLARVQDEPGSIAELDAEVTTARAVGPLPHALVLLARSTADADPEGAEQALVMGRQNGFGAFLTRLPGVTVISLEDPRSASLSPLALTTTAELPIVEPEAAEEALEVRCMGELHVALGGVDCDVAQLRPRHQELLSILVAHPNVWLHREKLFEWLWPGTTTAKATRNLQVAISAVRKLVEPASGGLGQRAERKVIVRNGERYRMLVAREHSDVCRLEWELGSAQSALRSSDIVAAATSLERALAEWRGEPVPWVGPTDWAVERRRQLSQHVGKVAIGVVGELGDRDRWDLAAGLAARAVEVDDMDDRLWRLAVTAAVEAGSAVLAANLEQRYRTLVGS